VTRRRIEAYISSYPLEDNYRVAHDNSMDRNFGQFKSPWNHIGNLHHVYLPADPAVQPPTRTRRPVIRRDRVPTFHYINEPRGTVREQDQSLRRRHGCSARN
jgi:hypothetical protein